MGGRAGAHLGKGKIDIEVLCGTSFALEENAKMDRAQQRYLKQMKRVLVLGGVTQHMLYIIVTGSSEQVTSTWQREREIIPSMSRMAYLPLNSYSIYRYYGEGPVGSLSQTQRVHWCVS